MLNNKFNFYMYKKPTPFDTIIPKESNHSFSKHFFLLKLLIIYTYT